MLQYTQILIKSETSFFTATYINWGNETDQ